MEQVIVCATLAGSLGVAFAMQKLVLGALFRAMGLHNGRKAGVLAPRIVN